MIQAIYFDLDGTLFDDRQYVRAGLLQAAENLEDRVGVNIADELLNAYFSRNIREKTFDTVLKEEGLPPELVSTLVDAYHDNEAKLVPFPEATKTLENLHKEYQIGLITGGTNGRQKLRRLNLERYFEVVIVTSDQNVTKRDAVPFEEALDTLDVSAEEAVFVGDRPSLDFIQPNRLGMYTVRVRTGQYKETAAPENARPDITIDTLCELPSALKELQQGL